MGQHKITMVFELNDAQELLIDSVYSIVEERYNYIRSDVVDRIIHSSLYYDFFNEDRTEYNSLLIPILNMIADTEEKLNTV